MCRSDMGFLPFNWGLVGSQQGDSFFGPFRAEGGVPAVDGPVRPSNKASRIAGEEGHNSAHFLRPTHPLEQVKWCRDGVGLSRFPC